MKVIVLGAGQVGFHIARHLAHQQNDVTVIDRSPRLIRKMTESLDVSGFSGHASNPDLLERANAADADMIIAVTASDEVNMVACQVAHSLFQVPTKVARIRNQAYLKGAWADLFSHDNMPIDVIISPELEVARSIYRRLEVPGAFEVIPLAGGKIRVLGIRLEEDCPVVDTPLRQLTELFPDMAVTVQAIIRGGNMFVPSGDDPMEVGDAVYVATDSRHLDRVLSVFGHEEQEARRIVIIGGGNVGFFLAGLLEKSKSAQNVKIIEKDQERAEHLAEGLDRTVIIQGDALETDILKEANTRKAETLVAVSNDDEVNILTSLLAKSLGALRVITLVNKPIFTPLLESLGIDVHVDPREITVSTILQQIRRGRIRSVHSIHNGEAEILEAEVPEASPLAGQSLRDADLPDHVMIGAIVRGEDVIAPRGDTVFEVGDRVVVLALESAVPAVEKMFAVRLDYF